MKKTTIFTSTALSMLMFVTTLAQNQESSSKTDGKIIYPKEIENCEPCKRLWLANNQRRQSEIKVLASMKLTKQKYSDSQNLFEVFKAQYAGMKIADWENLLYIDNVDDWVTQLNIQPGDTFFVSKNGNLKSDTQEQYFVLYEPTGKVPDGWQVEGQVKKKLFLCCKSGKKCPILLKK